MWNSEHTCCFCDIIEMCSKCGKLLCIKCGLSCVEHDEAQDSYEEESD